MTMNATDFSAEWRASTQKLIDAIVVSIQDMRNQMIAMASNVSSMTARLEELVQDRVSRESYTVAHKALEDRVAKLESGPSNLVPWIGLGCSAISVLMTMLALAGGVLIYVVTHH